MRELKPEDPNRVCACGRPARWKDPDKQPVCDRCKRCEEILYKTSKPTCGKGHLRYEEYDDSCRRRTGGGWRIMN